MLTTSCSSWPASGPDVTLGRSIATPCCRIGAVTMKMMSSTSMTSTSGVTLMSEIAPPSLGAPNAMLFLQKMPLGDVEELGAEVIHLCRQHAKLAGETVVHHHGRDGSSQTDGRGNERLRDAGCDGLDARRRRGREPHERRHDAPHGAEEPDERGGAGRRGEEGEATLEAGHLLGARPLHGALHGLDAADLRLPLAVLAGAALEPREPLQLLVARPEHLRHRAVLHVR